MARITGRTILVVGASSGIGAEVTRLLAAKEVRAAGSACLDIPGDALDPRSAADVATAAVDTYGSIDVALLNAGQGPDMSMDEVSVAEISQIMALNYGVVVNYLVPLVQQLGSQPGGGLIAHTNSPAGLIGVPRQGPYGAAKAAARTLLDAARVELAPRGIRFTSLHPGFVATDRVSTDGLPKPFQISQERAARYAVRALEKEPAQAYFPWTTAALVRALRVLPTPVSSLILRRPASR